MERTIEAFETFRRLIYPLAPVEVALRIGTPTIEKKHAEVERIFASTETVDDHSFEIHVARDMECLKDRHIWGIMSHEWGHVLAIYLHGNHEESGADMVMLEWYGVPHEHGSFLNVQWLPPELIKKLRALARRRKNLAELKWARPTSESERRRVLNASPYRGR